MLAHVICFYKPKGGSLTTVVFWCISECVRQNKNRNSKYGHVSPIVHDCNKEKCVKRG